MASYTLRWPFIYPLFMQINFDTIYLTFKQVRIVSFTLVASHFLSFLFTDMQVWCSTVYTGCFCFINCCWWLYFVSVCLLIFLLEIKIRSLVPDQFWLLFPAAYTLHIAFLMLPRVTHLIVCQLSNYFLASFSL